jgi:hypothetical protein
MYALEDPTAVAGGGGGRSPGMQERMYYVT